MPKEKKDPKPIHEEPHVEGHLKGDKDHWGINFDDYEVVEIVLRVHKKPKSKKH